MIILATTLFVLFLFFVFRLEEKEMFYDDLLREARVFEEERRLKEKHRIKPGMLVTRPGSSTDSPLKCKDIGLVTDIYYGGEFGNPRAVVIWSGETRSEKWLCDFLCPLG